MIRAAFNRYKLRVDSLLDVRTVRWLFAAVCLARSTWYRLRGKLFQSADATLRCSRVLSTRPNPTVPSWIERANDRLVATCVPPTQVGNPLLRDYASGADAAAFRAEFSGYGREYARALKYPRPNDRPDREGDLVVLKPPIGPRERGVLLVSYNTSLRKFAAIYDLPRLARRYRFVLEPSTWGYQEATFLMFLGLPTDVVVEAPFARDRDYINSLGGNLHGVGLGAGDWVDPDLFRAGEGDEKTHDLIMVASWLRLKRHELLFRALSQIRGNVGRVALVGYPWGDRTAEDVRREARQHGVLELLDFHERIPPSGVAELLRRSKVLLMLSLREGASRAVYESFFSNTPVIVSAANIGVNRDHINDCTGVFSTDADLGASIVHMIENHRSFSPRSWALETTGFRNSTRRLNGILSGLARRSGEDWTEDIFHKKNQPNAMYAIDVERDRAHSAFADLDQFLI